MGGGGHFSTASEREGHTGISDRHKETTRKVKTASSPNDVMLLHVALLQIDLGLSKMVGTAASRSARHVWPLSGLDVVKG